MKKYEEAEKSLPGAIAIPRQTMTQLSCIWKKIIMKNGQLRPGCNIQVAITDQYVVDFALYSILFQPTLNHF